MYCIFLVLPSELWNKPSIAFTFHCKFMELPLRNTLARKTIVKFNTSLRVVKYIQVGDYTYAPCKYFKALVFDCLSVANTTKTFGHLVYIKKFAL